MVSDYTARMTLAKVFLKAGGLKGRLRVEIENSTVRGLALQFGDILLKLTLERVTRVPSCNGRRRISPRNRKSSVFFASALWHLHVNRANRGLQLRGLSAWGVGGEGVSNCGTDAA